MHCTLVNMEMKIIIENENALLKRKELVLEMKHESAATPSKAEITSTLAAKHSVDPEHVVIDYILTRKGVNESVVKAKIYKEKPKMKTKVKAKKEEAKSEAPAGKAA